MWLNERIKIENILKDLLFLTTIKLEKKVCLYLKILIMNISYIYINE